MMNHLRKWTYNTLIRYNIHKNVNRIIKSPRTYSSSGKILCRLSNRESVKGKRFYSGTSDLSLDWENAEEIADLLFEEYKDLDPLTLRFEELENMIIETVVNKNKMKLSGYCNEGVLENIQMNWLEKYNEANE